ncbi:hypothetical protein [Azospirillum sp. sgz302134]
MQTEQSKRDKAISAAGAEIERALHLAGSTDVLARWMAYRLAELDLIIAEAPNAAERSAAKTERDELILALWRQRAALPITESDRQLKTSLGLLTALLDDPKPWRRDEPRVGTPEALVEALRQASARMVSAAAVLIRTRHELEGGPEDPDLPLAEEEAEIRSLLDKLRGRVIRDIMFVADDGAPGAEPSLEEEIALLERKVDNELSAIVEAVTELRTVLLNARPQPAPPEQCTTKPAK